MIHRIKNAAAAKAMLDEVKRTSLPLRRGETVIVVTCDELLSAGRKAKRVVRFVNRHFKGLTGTDITFHVDKELLDVFAHGQTICNKILSRASGASQSQQAAWRKNLKWFKDGRKALKDRQDLPAGGVNRKALDSAA